MNIFSGIKKFIESKTGVRTEDFEEKGLLTPEMFTEAGDQLTNFGWKWEGSLNKPTGSLQNPKKQFLSSKATSKQRIKTIMNEEITE